MMLNKQLKQMREATMERMPRSIIKVFTDSIDSLKKDQYKQKALQLGEVVPNLFLKNNNGEDVLLSNLIQTDFLILNFYRGGWCPYCNLELRAYEKLRKAFNAVNTDIVGISAETITRATNTREKNTLTFPVLTDVNAKLMKAMGIVFPLDEASKKEFKNFGMDFSEIHGNTNDELPIPAVYVINKNREVVYIHFEENYMTRLEPTELLNTLTINI